MQRTRTRPSAASGMFRDVFHKTFGDVPALRQNESAKAESGSKARIEKFDVGKMGKGVDVFIGDDFIGKVWEVKKDGKTKYQVQQRKNNKWLDKGQTFDGKMAAVNWLKGHK